MVVPLLKRSIWDKEPLIRSFIVMGLGAKRNDEGYETLLHILEHENDPNVIAEVANSLANFGLQAIPHLTALFKKNSHWLIRQSIFPVLDYPESFAALVQLCRLGYQDEDQIVKLAAIANLERLRGTAQAPEALNILLQAATDSNALIRAKVAQLLIHFDVPEAQTALEELKQDSDYRVIKVFLERLLS
ncbi:MAG: HEAT repeat domain-containing protein [Cyanobacteria bacterium P01_D01_bin.156]